MTERRDVTIATGAAWTESYVRYTPGPPVPAGTVTAGQRVYVGGVPLLVARVEPAGVRTTLVFGQGLHDDPTLTLVSTDLVSPAGAVPIDEAAAAWETVPVINALDVVSVEIPTTVEPDGTTVTLSMGADETALLAPDEGAHSWDLYVRTAAEDWVRALEGTLTIVRGDAR